MTAPATAARRPLSAMKAAALSDSSAACETRSERRSFGFAGAGFGADFTSGSGSIVGRCVAPVPAPGVPARWTSGSGSIVWRESWWRAPTVGILMVIASEGSRTRGPLADAAAGERDFIGVYTST